MNVLLHPHEIWQPLKVEGTSWKAQGTTSSQTELLVGETKCAC